MENILKEITSVVNHKGGVAKTSTVYSLAGGLLRESRGKAKVLVIDMDPQCNLSLLCGWDKNNKELPTMYEALRDASAIPVYKNKRGIYFCPSSKKLQQIDLELFRQLQPNQVLRECFCNGIDDHTGEGFDNVVNFDYVFIDCPPALSTSTFNSMAVSSRVLIPMQLDPLSINGLSTILLEQARAERSLRQEEKQKVSILPVIVDMRTKICRDYMAYLKESYSSYLTNTFIRQDVKMRDAQGELKDIFEYAPYTRVAIDYENLIKELYN